MTRPTLYIAGPYTRPDPVINTHKAIRVATIIYDQSYWVPVVPHLTLLWHMVDPHPIEFWYEYDLHVMRGCDAVVRLPGPSSGADAELLAAMQFPMPVIEYQTLPALARATWEAPS